MIVYKNDALGFREDVDDNRIVPAIDEAFASRLGRRAAPGERRAWSNSLRYMETVIRRSGLPDDCGILVEYGIPSTSRRIDFIISGHDDEEKPNFVIVELKQWDKAYPTGKTDIVMSYVNGAVREVPHPSYQSYSYKKYLSDMNEAIYTNNIYAYSCAYLHNYVRNEPEPLVTGQYKYIVEDTPVFFSEDSKNLALFISRYVGKGRGLDILYSIENGKIKPSKKFIEYIGEMFEGNKVFTLLDEQKVAYENIISCALNAQRRTTIIVNGEPGTGKSVVAVNAFVEILKNGRNIKFVAPNASFRNAMTDMITKQVKKRKVRLNVLFSGSASYFNAEDCEFDVLVVDEAHRLKKKGAFQYKGKNQIEDILKASKINVFFIDDNQRIRPEDVGTVNGIKDAAAKYGSKVIEIKLEAQFRCAGAEGFINWVNHNLHLQDTANFDGWEKDDYDFRIFDSPRLLFDEIKSKHLQGYKARMLAGYAWPWTSEKEGNYDANIKDVKIGEHDFEMPWNSRKDQYAWAMDNDKVDQIGCIHTSQGLEFDYVGVIIGGDLRFDPEKMEYYSSYDSYYDRTGKKGLKHKPEELTKLIKNIYKVLMTRGMKGCYIFCTDKNLQIYLKNRLKVKAGS